MPRASRDTTDPPPKTIRKRKCKLKEHLPFTVAIAVVDSRVADTVLSSEPIHRTDFYFLPDGRTWKTGEKKSGTVLFGSISRELTPYGPCEQLAIDLLKSRN
jgi:hypothetical protein